MKHQQANPSAILKPSREGLLVPYPATRRMLPAEGASVRLNTYWRRRLLRGDVVEVSKSKKTAKKSES